MNNMIDYYQPRMDVITNALASSLIRKLYLNEVCIADKIDYEDVSYIFAGMANRSG